LFENIRKSRCTNGINDTCGVNDTGEKFAPGVNYTGGNLPPVSMTTAANFATSTAGVDNTGGKFAPVLTLPVANLLADVNHTDGK
jgi:hypothetical protein